MMVDVVKNNMDKIVDACMQMQVKSLYLFGSGARDNDYSPKSDIDFLYTMKTDEQGLPISKFDYFDLMWKLEEITGKKVDLVAEQGIRNKYFLQSILEDRIKLYEAQPAKYLEDIRLSILDIETYVSNISTSKQVEENQLLFDALCRRFAIIGEAIFQADKLDGDLKITDKIKITGLRHIIVHDYDLVRAPDLWNIIVNKLPLLKEEVEHLLEELTGN